ncbi:MAG: Hpt domain-containing protein, partial [Planctomycetota bacterium]
LFQDNFNELLTELKTALEQKNTDILMRTAHTIKGSTGNIGFTHLSEIAREIQDNPGDFDMIAKAIPKMESIYQKLDALVKSETESMS